MRRIKTFVLRTARIRNLPVPMPMAYAIDFFLSTSNAFRGLSSAQNPISFEMHPFFLLSLTYLLWKLYVRCRDNPRSFPFPPGPKPLPLVGNLFDFPRENESVAYLKMAQKYGGTSARLVEPSSKARTN